MVARNPANPQITADFERVGTREFRRVEKWSRLNSGDIAQTISQQRYHPAVPAYRTNVAQRWSTGQHRFGGTQACQSAVVIKLYRCLSSGPISRGFSGHLVWSCLPSSIHTLYMIPAKLSNSEECNQPQCLDHASPHPILPTIVDHCSQPCPRDKTLRILKTYGAAHGCRK